MGKKRKLRKHMKKHDKVDEVAVVVCVGKSCAAREVTKALGKDLRAYAADHTPGVRVELVKCLHVCKKGPIAATYPDIEFHKRVDAAEGHAMLDAQAVAAPVTD